MQESAFIYSHANAVWDSYVYDAVFARCKQLHIKTILDIGCGNGVFAARLAAAGYQVTACDPSPSGIAVAREAYPAVEFHQLGVYDAAGPLSGRRFDLVVSLEVIEHLFDPAALLRFARPLLEPAGHLMLSTPYHGYIKNLAIAALGRADHHYQPLTLGGHIKFFSNQALRGLLEANGFRVARMSGVGRVPLLWKSVIAEAELAQAQR